MLHCIRFSVEKPSNKADFFLLQILHAFINACKQMRSD